MNYVYNPYFKDKVERPGVKWPPVSVQSEPSAGQRIPRGLIWHRVRPGDTLSSIAEEYDTVALALTMLNSSVNFNHLRAGTRIRLYANPLAPNCTPDRQYTIGSGEDIHSIAKKFSTTENQLLMANPLYPPSYFRQGHVICRPSR